MVLATFWFEAIKIGKKRFKNMKTVHTRRYMFLFKEPITYTRPLISRVTNVKLLVVLYSKKVNHCAVYLYEANDNVNWNEILTKKTEYMKLTYNDTFFIENDNLDWFLQYFGLE